MCIRDSLVQMKALVWEEESLGAKFHAEDIPADLADKVAAAREKLLEAIADSDEALMEKYLEGGEITVEEVQSAVRQATLAGAIVPVLAGSAFKNKGVQPLLDAVVDYLPSPLDKPSIEGVDPDGKEMVRKSDDAEPFSALAFKIMNDPFVGSLTFFRVYSGRMESGSYVLNTSTGKKERVGRLLKLSLIHI